jgi:RimJ/RimL family protein N-acetyltransferase
MKFIIQRIREREARQIATWGYDEPYGMYSLTALAIPALLDPEYRYHIVRDETGELVGFCCFGLDARVSGGVYTQGEPEVLDVGVGMHPGWVGKGHGRAFVAAVLGFAVVNFNPDIFRVTIAAFNQRSQRVFLGLGFKQTERFDRDSDGMKFVQLEREAS